MFGEGASRPLFGSCPCIGFRTEGAGRNISFRDLGFAREAHEYLGFIRFVRLLHGKNARDMRPALQDAPRQIRFPIACTCAPWPLFFLRRPLVSIFLFLDHLVKMAAVQRRLFGRFAEGLFRLLDISLSR